jgi:peroxiredoxin Q/BCP
LAVLIIPFFPNYFAMKKCKLCAILLAPLSLFAPSLISKPLELGSKVPPVTALDDQGQSIELQQRLASGFALVYFYPKSFTGGCTAQACSLRDAWTELAELGVVIYGVSSDSVATQAAFREKHNLPFALLADGENTVGKAFGAPAFSRQAYLFKDGVLVWRDLRASTRNQAEDVLKAISTLGDNHSN